jgi:bifunctional UDP-N-acetylglucosamine pyrophosphorylase/glucosamine-1-phosphate N-acetyltransferase
MKSHLPKLLHPIAGQAMILHSLSALADLSEEPPIAIVGHQSEMVRRVVGDQAEFVEQSERLGTGHAVLQAKELLEGKADLIVVCNADLPLISQNTINKLVDAHKESASVFTMLSVDSPQPRGFGRIIRGESQEVTAIVEEAEASSEQRKISELNVGVYCFQANWLWSALEKIKPSAAKGEFYLTDLVEIAVADDLRVGALILEDSSEAIGVNDRVHLAQAAQEMRKLINQRLMLAGVTLVDPNSTYIDSAVVIGQDSVIWPNTTIQGNTQIGEDCSIGPNTFIRDSQIHDHCKIEASYVEHAVVEDRVDIGPFAHMRKGAHLSEGVHIGNYGEVKNSQLGPGVKMGHFSYIGDANIGANTNVGAGTITANYDGSGKHKTEIGENVFIGSDTMLVAPLKIGSGARTGAGAVVTKDVAADTIVVGIPARAIRKVEKSD